MYRRIHHAAHYMWSRGGHDLEEWDVIAPARPQTKPAGVPADAEFDVGYVDHAGYQHWVYTRIAPFGTRPCSRCGGEL